MSRDSKEKAESTIPNPKSNSDVRLDSNNDEIVYEVKYKLSWWDYGMCLFMFLVGGIVLLAGIDSLLLNKIEIIFFVIVLLPFGILCVVVAIYDLFYTRKNRFYVTNSGIGFERRHWFRMQKRFFKFGEVGVIINHLLPMPSYNTWSRFFIVYPLKIDFQLKAFLGYIRDKNHKYYMFCHIKTNLFSYNNEKEIITFIRQKTKKMLESKNIAITDAELKDKFKSLLHKEI